MKDKKGVQKGESIREILEKTEGDYCWDIGKLREVAYKVDQYNVNANTKKMLSQTILKANEYNSIITNDLWWRAFQGDVGIAVEYGVRAYIGKTVDSTKVGIFNSDIVLEFTLKTDLFKEVYELWIRINNVNKIRLS